MDKRLPKQIIYINGPTSAGKSTLAKKLQGELQGPFLIVGIDMIISMMPEKLNDWHHGIKAAGFSWQPVKDDKGDICAYKIETGSFGKRMVQALKDITVTLAQSGHYIIVDDVSFGKEQVDEWRDVLKGFDVLWIGLIAPIEVLQQRELNRGDRKLKSCAWQAERVHVGVDYDLMFDTDKQSTDEIIKIIRFT
jgi:chloramphenicol 3-O phosphotransferase